MGGCYSQQLTSPGRSAACVPAARQRSGGDGAGCTGSRTPAAPGSVTGPQTPEEGEGWRETSAEGQRPNGV